MSLTNKLINLNQLEIHKDIDFDALSRISKKVFVIQDEVKEFGQEDEYPHKVLHLAFHSEPYIPLSELKYNLLEIDYLADLSYREVLKLLYFVDDEDFEG